jgi:hypothetical protein
MPTPSTNTIQVVISAVDKTATGITRAVNNLDSFKKSAGALLNTMTVVGAGIAASLVAVTQRAITMADEMGKAAQKAGMGTLEFSKLAYAAKFSNVEIETLQKSIKGLSTAIVSALNDPTKEAGILFRQMGVELRNTDGSVRSTRDIFLDTAQAFSTYADNANKVNLATKLFGKSGQEIIPLLNETKDSIVALGNETIGVTEEMARQADAYGDNMDRLKGSLGQVGLTIAESVLPVLVKFSESLAESARSSTKLMAPQLIEFLRGLASVVVSVKLAFEVVGAFLGTTFFFQLQTLYELVSRNAQNFVNIGRAIYEVGKAIVSVASDFEGFGNVLSMLATGNYVAAGAAAATLAGVHKEQLNVAMAQLEVTAKSLSTTLPEMFSTIRDNGVAAVTQLGSATKGAVAEWKSLQQAIFATTSGPTSVGAKTEGEKQDAPTGAAEGGTSFVKMIDEQIKVMGRFAKAMAEAKRRERAEQFMTMDAYTYSLGNMAEASAMFGKKTFKITKAFQIAHAIMYTYAAAARAMAEVPWPASIAVAASQIVLGLARVAMISKTEPQGYASGADYIPQDQMAKIHAGERIVPSTTNQDLTDFLRSGQSQGGASIVLDGRELGRAIYNLARQGRLQIPASAIVA